ncbi:hypothetical protein [Bacillus cereus]
MRVNSEIVQSKQPDDMKISFTESYPKHGDKVQIVAHTYTGEVVEIPQQLAGTVGDVRENQITSMHEVTEWKQNVDKRYTTIIFDASKLKDEIQAHIQSYTIEYNCYPYSGDWTRFGANIQMYADGTLHLDDCKAPKLLGAHVALRITANLYENTIKPIVVFNSGTGLLTQVPKDDILSLYKNATWDVVNPGEFYTTLRLEKDKIAYQDYIQYYDIVVDGKSYKKLINPFNPDGTLSLKGFDVNPLPKHATRPITTTNHMSRVTVDAHLFGGPVYKNVSISYPGTKGQPPTEAQIIDAHKNPKWNFQGDKLSSITFPGVTSDMASYISSYQMKRWSELIKETVTFEEESNGVTMKFSQPIEVTSMQDVSIGNGKTEKRQVNDKFTVLVTFVNLDKMVEVVHEMEPQKTVSDDDLKNAHVIENPIYTWDDKKWTAFYFNQEKLQPYLKTIAAYEISINGTPAPKKWENKDFSDLVEGEVDKNNKQLGKKGLPMRFGTFGIYDGKNNPLPAINDYLDVTVTTKSETKIKVITKFKIN